MKDCGLTCAVLTRRQSLRMVFVTLAFYVLCGGRLAVSIRTKPIARIMVAMDEQLARWPS